MSPALRRALAARARPPAGGVGVGVGVDNIDSGTVVVYTLVARGGKSKGIARWISAVVEGTRWMYVASEVEIGPVGTSGGWQ